MQDKYGHSGGCDILLIGQVAIDGYECREFSGAHATQQLAIAKAGPSKPSRCRNLNADQRRSEAKRHAFIEQDLHYAAVARASSISFANSSTATACSRVTLGKSARKSSSGSPASK